jgi:hypothetical protein
MKKKIMAAIMTLLVSAQLLVMPNLALAESPEYVRISGFEEGQWVSSHLDFTVSLHRNVTAVSKVFVRESTNSSANYANNIPCSYYNWMAFPADVTRNFACNVGTANKFFQSPLTLITKQNGGQYWVTVDVWDGMTKILEDNRSYRVDNEAPVIVLNNSNLNIKLEKGQDHYSEEGGVVTDRFSGPMGDLIISGSVNNEKVGIYPVTYIGYDNVGNKSSLTRIVEVVDTTAPVMTLLGDKEVTVTVGGTYTEPGAVTDDGSSVVISGSVDTAATGTYELHYNSADEFGNASVEQVRTVNVINVPVFSVIQNLLTTPIIQTAVAATPLATAGNTEQLVLGAQADSAKDVKGSQIVASNESETKTNSAKFGWAWIVLGLLIIASSIIGYRRYNLEK